MGLDGQFNARLNRLERSANEGGGGSVPTPTAEDAGKFLGVSDNGIAYMNWFESKNLPPQAMGPVVSNLVLTPNYQTVAPAIIGTIPAMQEQDGTYYGYITLNDAIDNDNIEYGDRIVATIELSASHTSMILFLEYEDGSFINEFETASITYDANEEKWVLQTNIDLSYSTVSLTYNTYYHYDYSDLMIGVANQE